VQPTKRPLTPLRALWSRTCMFRSDTLNQLCSSVPSVPQEPLLLQRRLESTIGSLALRLLLQALTSSKPELVSKLALGYLNTTPTALDSRPIA